MTLVVFEETLKNLFMTAEGEEALGSKETLEAFLKKSGLNQEEQEYVLAQPLERYEQYQFMLYANVKDTLEAIFPFTQEVIGEELWDTLTKDYMYNNPPTSHHLINAGEQFPQYLENYPNLLSRYPFLIELANYEWAEAELLSVYDDEIPDGIEKIIPASSEDLFKYLPFINTTASFLNLNYSIPEIIEFLKKHDVAKLPLNLTTPQTKLMWIYRLRSPYHCRFFELTPPLASWLAEVFNLQQSGELLSYEETLAPIHGELVKFIPDLTREQFDEQFLKTLAQLLEDNILIGSIPLPS